MVRKYANSPNGLGLKKRKTSIYKNLANGTISSMSQYKQSIKGDKSIGSSPLGNHNLKIGIENNKFKEASVRMDPISNRSPESHLKVGASKDMDNKTAKNSSEMSYRFSQEDKDEKDHMIQNLNYGEESSEYEYYDEEEDDSSSSNQDQSAMNAIAENFSNY